MVPLFRIILALVCCTGIGCMGVSQNPSYFPYLLPSGDVIRTHGKPGGIGYFRNYDPKAIQVEVFLVAWHLERSIQKHGTSDDRPGRDIDG